MAIFNVPLNNVSFGQVSLGLLREAFSRKESVPIFPIGNVDLSSERENEAFAEWVNLGVNKGLTSFDRTEITVKLWHLRGESFFYPTDRRFLISFYELDQPTDHEIKIVKNCDKVFFTSQYTCDVFAAAGCDNVEHLPLFFDSHNFKKIDKKYFDDDRIVFNVVGKFEHRKHHAKVIKSWVKKFGSNKKYFLNCAVYNSFMSQEDNNKVLSMALDNKRVFNTNFLAFMAKNEMYNDFLNSGDIILGMSGGEGWGLPEFHSVGLGKHAVILDCNGYKSWANEENSTLVPPSRKIPAYDNVFFTEGQHINQGSIFDFDEDDFISGCEEAIKKVELNRINEKGLGIQEKFKVQYTYDKITDQGAL